MVQLSPVSPDMSLAAAVRVGFMRGFPIVLGYIPLGFAFGVLALQNGIPGFVAVLMSVVIFAGSGQFIAAGMWGAGASVLAIIATNFVVNLRYLLMCAALAPWLGRFTLLQQALFSSEIVDENFAVHANAMRAGEQAHLPVLMATNMTAHGGWIFGTLLGVISGELLSDPRSLGLDYALPAMFLALLIPQCRERLHVLIAVLSGVTSVGLVLVGAGRWNVILATIIGATLGAWLMLRKERKAGAA